MFPMKSVNESTANPVRSGTGIVIIYEDRATGLRAKRFADMLAASLGSECDCGMALWRSELIELPELAHEIARDAAASEFVIVSLRSDTSLSIATKDLLESWLALAAGGPSSLIALFDPVRTLVRFAESARFYLRQVATDAGVAFFGDFTAAPNEAKTIPFPVDAEEPVASLRRRRARSRRVEIHEGELVA